MCLSQTLIGLLASLIPGQPLTTEQKPVAKVVVEGELSPFEDEALYRILKKSFKVEHPTYTELQDEDIVTRVNVLFHQQYSNEFFREVIQEGWRDLKALFREVRHRRGKAGAEFIFTFLTPANQLVFKSGVLDAGELSSALDQIGHLTAIVAQMLRPEIMERSIERIETSFDSRSDRWHMFKGSNSTSENYVFDESLFRWVPV